MSGLEGHWQASDGALQLGRMCKTHHVMEPMKLVSSCGPTHCCTLWALKPTHHPNSALHLKCWMHAHPLRPESQPKHLPHQHYSKGCSGTKASGRCEKVCLGALISRASAFTSAEALVPLVNWKPSACAQCEEDPWMICSEHFKASGVPKHWATR